MRFSTKRWLVLISCLSLKSYFFFNLTVNEIVDPVILEIKLRWIKPFFLCNNLNFLVVVRSTTISCNNSSFKVCMFKINSWIVLQWALALCLAFSSLVIHDHLTRGSQSWVISSSNPVKLGFSLPRRVFNWSLIRLSLRVDISHWSAPGNRGFWVVELACFSLSWLKYCSAFSKFLWSASCFSLWTLRLILYKSWALLISLFFWTLGPFRTFLFLNLSFPSQLINFLTVFILRSVILKFFLFVHFWDFKSSLFLACSSTSAWSIFWISLTLISSQLNLW